MAKSVKDLTSDQLRRIFRDYLKGVPPERLIKKYDLSEGTFWEIVGMYSKKKHPNDVGNAKDILGPADLLVTPLDTGSGATEHPIKAYSPRDLKAGGTDAEDTAAILTDLAKTSEAEAKAIKSQAAETAKATPAIEDQLRAAREAREARVIADQAAEDAINQKRLDHAQERRQKDAELVEAGKKQNEELLKQQNEARSKEREERAADADKLRKEAEGAEQRLADLTHRGSDEGGKAGSSEQRHGGSEGAGSDQQPQKAGAGEEVTKTPPVPVANTSATAKPDAVQPAKVEPGKLEGKK